MPDVLFAPWRYEYLVADKSGGCIFCEAVAAPGQEESLVVFRGRKVFVILNRYPYTNGHVMVAPYEHEAWLSGSDAATQSELISTIARAEKILVSEYHTDGLNVGINFGSAAGAGVAGHYHVHVVPRWSGDTNFMTVASGVRIIPEEHAATLARLRPLFAEASA
ncbi:MAG TPA: HIT domain-containing protein [Thermoanaerobaculia bacterium]|jgi:ATP adenylyltransferase|nr:HIT domain-containing protein [Thermoanaerobaculia bacterium]